MKGPAKRKHLARQARRAVKQRPKKCGLCGTTDGAQMGAVVAEETPHGTECPRRPWRFCAVCAPLVDWEDRLTRILRKLTPMQKRAMTTALVMVAPAATSGTASHYDEVAAVYTVAEKWAGLRPSGIE